jgi:hypothetical protein
VIEQGDWGQARAAIGMMGTVSGKLQTYIMGCVNKQGGCNDKILTVIKNLFLLKY